MIPAAARGAVEKCEKGMKSGVPLECGIEGESKAFVTIACGTSCVGVDEDVEQLFMPWTILFFSIYDWF